MKVWEDFIESNKKLMKKLGYSTNHDNFSPWRGRGQDGVEAAHSFFGLDAEGNRID